MTLFLRSAFWALVLLLCSAAPAAAAEVKTFTVLPFTVNGPAGYKYLEQSIPQMFASRLYWKGQLENAPAPAGKQAPAADENAAEKARAAADADFVVWGSVTVIGEEASLDVRVRDKAGKVWPRSREAKVSQLIPALKGVSDSISAEVFQRPRQQPAARAQASNERVNRMNPDLVHNETTPREVYMNPAFRYSGTGGDETRLRSQTMPFASFSMEVCDADGDGKNEIFILGEHELFAFRFNNGRLDQIGNMKIPLTLVPLQLRSIDLNRTRRPFLILTTTDEEAREPYSYILSFTGSAFKEEAFTRSYYLNVVSLAPMFRPRLIGQMANPPQLFRPGVFEVNVHGKDIRAGARISLPEKSNVFNFAYVPPGKAANDTTKVVMFTEKEKIRLHSERGARLAETDESFGGSSVYMLVNPAMPGLGRDYIAPDQLYYIPMRFVVADLARDGTQQILVNKPISSASTIFADYRNFPQSEIHSLYWDGVGLNLLWKTRRIKGAMVDYAIADLNNDGIMDLVTCLNSYTGALGIDSRKTMVVAYPLDMNKTDGNTAPDRSEYEQEAPLGRP